MREINDVKFFVLSLLDSNPNLSAKEISEFAYPHFKPDISFETYRYWRIPRMLNHYCTAYDKPILKRKKEGGAYKYSLTKEGEIRLTQLSLAQRIFGSLKLKYYNVQVFTKNSQGAIRVNPDILPYVPKFSKTPVEKLMFLLPN